MLDGKKQGYGTEIYHDGSFYLGAFEQGFKSGKGVYVKKNGDYYIGDWLDNQPDGEGENYCIKDDLHTKVKFSKGSLMT